jgi:hypothetical protein
MKTVVVALVCVLSPAWSFAESISVKAPSLTVEPGGTGTFTVSAAFEGSSSVAGYNLTLSLVPRDGAKGVELSGVSKASSDFLFQGGSSNGTGSTTPSATLIYYAGNLDSGVETISNTTRNIFNVGFTVAPNASGIYDLKFVAEDEGCSIYDGDALPISSVSYTNGTITVKTVPEPSTLIGLGTLAAIGLVVVGRRKGWALAA